MSKVMKRKRSCSKKFNILGMILVLFTISIFGTACGNPEKVGETKATSTDASTKDKKQENKTFKVGDVVKLNDFKVTVNKVYTVQSKDEFSKPEEGKEFIAVDCTVENTSKEEKTVSSMMMFKVVDEAGRECENSITGQTAANAGQMDGTVGPGRKLTGAYVVEVPKGKKGLELEFDSSLISGGQMVVKLN